MEKILTYQEAITTLSNSVSRAKANGDDGIYKIIQLESSKIANGISNFFSNDGLEVDLYNTGKAGCYGFFICWDY